MKAGAAELAGKFRQDSPEWHEFRASVIGSSDVAAILGLSGFKSAYTLWHEKAGLLTPLEPDERMKRKLAYGHHMEPFIAGLFAERHPEFSVQETGSWRNVKRPWQGCNPDRLLALDTDTDNLEFTSVMELKTFPTLADWADGVPAGYRAQLLWQMDTFGFRHGYIAAYANMSGDYVEYEFELDPFEADAVRARVQAFTESIDEGILPDIDGSADTYQSIRRLNPSLTPKQEVQIPEDVAESYLAARENYKAADSELTRWKGHLLAHMGTAQYAFHGEQKLASRVAVRDGVPYLKEA